MRLCGCGPIACIVSRSVSDRGHGAIVARNTVNLAYPDSNGWDTSIETVTSRLNGAKRSQAMLFRTETYDLQSRLWWSPGHLPICPFVRVCASTVRCADRSGETRTVTQDINVLALVKGEERYIFLYDDNRRAETLRTLGRFASDPNLTFSWYDAAVLSQKVRRVSQEQESSPASKSSRFELPHGS